MGCFLILVFRGLLDYLFYKPVMDNYLEIDSVLKSFDGRTILSDVYLQLKTGDIIGLFGRNGTGKSTLLKIIFGTLKAERSFLRIDGRIAPKQAFRTHKIAYLPQHNFLPNNLKIPSLLPLYLPTEIHKQFLSDPFIFKQRHAKVKELSGGEQRYLEIKLILYSSAPYILLDEPFNGLSPIAAKAIREHIAINAETKGILLTDHNFREVHQVINRIMLLNDCYLKEVTDPEELIPHGYYQKTTTERKE